MNVSDLNAIADRTDRDRSEIRTADPETSSRFASLAVKMKRSTPCETAGLRLRAIHQASRAKVPSVVGSRGF